jgi:hypothetical protein
VDNPQSQMADMGMTSPQLSFEVTGTGLCCVMFPAEIVPAAPTRAVSNGTYAVLTPVTTFFKISQTTTGAPRDQARIAGPPPQALLCVFLI